MNKKQIIVALLAVSCIAVNPMMAAAQPNAGLIARAKKEYKEFKSAFSCVLKSGFRACTPAQKKRIAVIATGIVGIASALVLAGGSGFAVWKSRQRPQAQAGGQVPEEGVGQVLIPPDVRELYAAIDRGDVGTVQALVRQGVDVNAQLVFHDKLAPLHSVIIGNISDERIRNELIKLLLSGNANINYAETEWTGTTPLMAAVRRGPEFVGTVRLLLERGANMAIKDEDGAMPLQYARDMKRDSGAQWDEMVDVLEGAEAQRSGAQQR